MSSPVGLEAVVDVVVGRADLAACEPADVLGEAPVGPDRVERRQAVLSPDLAVDFAEGRGEVHEPGALFGRDVVGRHDAPAVGPGGASRSVKGRS